jgi:hypothetical protein
MFKVADVNGEQRNATGCAISLTALLVSLTTVLTLYRRLFKAY